MSDYSWGVDGYGRQHICLNSDNRRTEFPEKREGK